MMNDSRAARPKPLDLSHYQQSDTAFAHLSIRDLIEARDLYHAHLVRFPNVEASAVGQLSHPQGRQLAQ